MALSNDYTTADHFRTGRGVDKNRYTVYPVVKDGVTGYAEYIDRTLSTETTTYALTLDACDAQMAVLELLAFFEADDQNTTGRYYVDSRVIGSYIFVQTVSTIETKMDNFTAGNIPEPT